MPLGVLTETLLDVMHDDLRARFVFNAGHVTLGLLGSIAGALALTGLLIFRSFVEAARVPTIRLASTRLEPDLDLDERTRGTSSSRTFGARVRTSAPRSSGSSACSCPTSPSFWTSTTLSQSTCSRSTSTRLPSSRSLSPRATYAAAPAASFPPPTSLTALVRACRFKSRNCLREVSIPRWPSRLRSFTTLSKGGASVQWIRREECPAELVAIFDAPGRKLIEWHRIKDFQVVSLKLIARQILHGCPAHARSPPGRTLYSR